MFVCRKFNFPSGGTNFTVCVSESKDKIIAKYLSDHISNGDGTYRNAEGTELCTLEEAEFLS